MNDVRVEAREWREQSLRDGWREWLCAICGAQLQGQRGGKACLACLGIDLERASTPPTVPTGPTTFSMSQHVQGSMNPWPTTTAAAPEISSTNLFSQGMADPWAPTFTTAPGTSTDLFPEGTTDLWAPTTTTAPVTSTTSNLLSNQDPQGTMDPTSLFSDGTTNLWASMPTTAPVTSTMSNLPSNQDPQGAMEGGLNTSTDAPTEAETMTTLDQASQESMMNFDWLDSILYAMPQGVNSEDLLGQDPDSY